MHVMISSSSKPKIDIFREMKILSEENEQRRRCATETPNKLSLESLLTHSFLLLLVAVVVPIVLSFIFLRTHKTYTYYLV